MHDFGELSLHLMDRHAISISSRQQNGTGGGYAFRNRLHLGSDWTRLNWQRIANNALVFGAASAAWDSCCASMCRI
jgi:hypothetical protein